MRVGVRFRHNLQSEFAEAQRERKNDVLASEARLLRPRGILCELGSLPSSMLIENRIKRKIEYEKTDREDKDESRFREELRDQVFPIKG